MSAVSFVADDLFVARVIKRLLTNPDNRWANSYEFKAINSGDTDDLLTMAATLLLYEQHLHSSSVQFTEMIVSTWEADSKPYDPTSFVTLPTAAIGTNAAAGDLLPLDKTLSVARVAETGRFGHLFYRGVLTEANVIAPAGKSVLSARADQDDLLADAITDSGMENYITPGDIVVPLRLVMINKTGTQVRLVNRLVVQGVGTVPTDHAWFNRSSTVSPGV